MKCVSFALTLALGVLTANIFRTVFEPEIVPIAPVTVDFKPNYKYQTPESEPYVTTKVIILFKPQLGYCGVTEKGQIRQNRVRRVVPVTFQADGKIGEVSNLYGFGDQATDDAIRLAKDIKFVPAKRDGIPVTVVEPVVFNF